MPPVCRVSTYERELHCRLNNCMGFVFSIDVYRHKWAPAEHVNSSSKNTGPSVGTYKSRFFKLLQRRRLNFNNLWRPSP